MYSSGLQSTGLKVHLWEVVEQDIYSVSGYSEEIPSTADMLKKYVSENTFSISFKIVASERAKRI